ncbi:aldose epimerase family protein [Sphingopyxis sp.]|uniref:aldose epimerase family protein n=1 Tax=Sphingopyxis sp. TaxID=1908224 RepID=UPI002ED7AAB5
MTTTDSTRIERRPWGTLPGGEAVTHILLSRPGGLSVGVSTLGATITAINAPGRDGVQANVVLGFDDLAGYLAPEYQASYPYFGATIGRVANRIRGAAFAIDGVRYSLRANEGAHQLHGGHGFDRAIWADRIDGDSLRLDLVSPDGDQGYPGTLQVSATFSLPADNELAVRYEARTDRATHVNLTTHGYFNLAGRDGPGIEGHHLQIHANAYTPIDADALPTGAIAAVDDTPFDVRQPQRIGALIDGAHPQLALGDGYNHNFVLNGTAGTLRPAARLHDPVSGRIMELATTAPGLQVYSGNALAEPVARRRQALALEPQHFPDTPNIAAFPTTLLRPGELYVSETRFRFLVD